MAQVKHDEHMDRLRLELYKEVEKLKRSLKRRSQDFRNLFREQFREHLESPRKAAKKEISAFNNKTAGIYLVGPKSSVQIMKVTLCDIEDETIFVTSRMNLAVEGSRFLSKCPEDASFRNTVKQPRRGSQVGIFFKVKNGNLSISDTVFEGFDHHAVDFKGEDLS